MRLGATRLGAAAGVLAFGLLLVGPGAGAEPVTSMPHQINDVNGRLASGEQSLRQALISLDEEDGIDLYVLSVDSTDGASIRDYADQVATSSGLGRDEPLFVMATQDEDYYLSVTDDFPLDDDELDRVTDAAETGFAAGDYAGAARAVSVKMAELITPGVSPAFVLGVGATVVGVSVIGVTWGVRRRRRRSADSSQWSPGGMAGPPLVPLDDLHRDVSRRLVATDEDVRGADRELAFAQAEFGDAAVAAFATALTEAKESMQAAFRLRQQLEDDIPEDEPTQRQMLAEIADRCDRAHETLAAQAGEFAALRDIASRASTLVPALMQRVDALDGGVSRAEATLSQLTSTFSPAAVAPVAHVPGDVRQRIAFARNALSGAGAGPGPVPDGSPAGGEAPPHVQALQAVKVPSAGSSAVAIRSAEIAVGEAEDLLAGVDRVAEQTRSAAQDLPSALAALEGDLAAAAGLPSSPAVQQAISTAQAAVQRAHAAGGGDPLATLTALTQADAGLDQAVASARDDQARAAQAAERLKRTVTVAQAALDQANALIGTHGDRVGPKARTHAAEAAQLLGEAQAGADPVQALAAAERANELAQLAVSAAQQDVAGPSWGGGPSWGSGPSWGNGPSWGGGGWGGGSVFGGGWSSGGSRRSSSSGWGGSSRSRSGGSRRGSGSGSSTRRASAASRSSGGGRRGSGRR